MKISEVLARLREFTDYIQQLGSDIATHGGQARTRWDYILGVYGPTPVLWVRGVMIYIHSPLQALTRGWEGCHDDILSHKKPNDQEMMAALELSPRNYELLDRAIHLCPRWHKQLRVDLIAALGLEDERTSNWFKATYEREYGHTRARC